MSIVDLRIVSDLPFAGDLAVVDRVRERLHFGGCLERKRAVYVAYVFAHFELHSLVVL